MSITDTAKAFLREALAAMYPAGSPADEASARRESRAGLVAACAAAAAAALALIMFIDGQVPLWGLRSLATVASVLGVSGGIVGAFAGVRAGTRSSKQPWRSRLSTTQRVLDGLAVVVLHATILALVALAVFAILNQAFRGLKLDTLTGVMTTAIGVASSAYVSYLSAADIDARRLSVLLAVFVTSGMLLSMVTAQEPGWWQLHFSELGASDGFSGDSFNITMIVAGIVLTALGRYITSDLRHWERTARPSTRRRVGVLRWVFVAVGVGLGGLALVPVNVNLVAHNVFAMSTAVAFGALLVSLRVILDGLPRAIFVFSDAVLLGLVGAVLLWWPIGYYNLTALEMIAAAAIFTWLIIFVRNIGALNDR